MKKAAFIEFNLSHSECIYSHLLYLKTAGYHVEFICNEIQRTKVAEIKKIADKTTFIKVKQRYFDKICGYIIGQKFDTVIIGSAFYRGDMNIVNRLSAQQTANFFAVLHSLNNVGSEDLTEPKHRQYTEKINRFFVLADYIAANAPKQTGFTYSVAPLIFQPDYPPVPIEKPDGDIWIAIPGAVNFYRRDYMALIPPKGEKYASNIKFILLGWDYGEKTTSFRNTLKECDIEDNFILFKHYVEGAEFQSWIRKCDYIMPLIHEKCTAFKDYLSVKISGNLNVALTYRKPMLCDEAFSVLPEYAAHSIFYKRDGLCGFVNSLEVPDTKKFYNENFERTHSLEVISKRYMKFLEMK